MKDKSKNVLRITKVRKIDTPEKFMEELTGVKSNRRLVEWIKGFTIWFWLLAVLVIIMIMWVYYFGIPNIQFIRYAVDDECQRWCDDNDITIAKMCWRLCG